MLPQKFPVTTNLLHILRLPLNALHLTQFLGQRWIVEAITEWITSPGSMGVGAFHDTIIHCPSPQHLHRKHIVIISDALRSICLLADQFVIETPDKSAWSEEEHLTRFIVRLVTFGRRLGNAWSSKPAEGDLYSLCVRALFLILWLRWIHQPILQPHLQLDQGCEQVYWLRQIQSNCRIADSARADL